MNTAVPVTGTIHVGVTWPDLWENVHRELKRLGYRRNTRRLYRHVLRSVAKFVRVAPAQVRESALHSYLVWQARRGATASWISANITVLRMVFDKMGGRALTRHMTTPRRPWPLPQVIGVADARRILAAAPTLRDQLMLGLLYGCGLKAGELSRLQWKNVEKLPLQGRLQLRLSDSRIIPIPVDLVPVLSEGLARCEPAGRLFTGSRPGKPISDRMVAWILRQAVKASGVTTSVDGMVLRHSYALHCLEAGVSIRDLQERLGHRQVKTTMIYLRMLHPGVVSPLDRLPSPSPTIPPQLSPPEAGPPPAETILQPLSIPPTPSRLPDSAPLFPAPLTAKPLDLPFAPVADSPESLAGRFHKALRSRLTGGFLALKRAIRSTS